LSSQGILDAQLEALVYGNVDVALTSWWGQSTDSDEFMNAALARTAQRPLRWAALYEDERTQSRSEVDITADLRYIDRTFAFHPNYLRVNRRWVLFVHIGTGDGCSTVAKWRDANEDVGAHLVFERFTGYAGCSAQPDAWFDEATNVAQLVVADHMFSVLPGYHAWDETSPRLARDLDRFRADVEAMVASDLPWQMVNSFNGWTVGTAVECGTLWTSPSSQGSYLDVLHEVPTR
jgi:hypothetical protein